MTILVLGCGGMIGNAIADRLAAAGKTVVRASRSAEKTEISQLYADRAQPATVNKLIDQHKITSIVDIVAYTEAETISLLAEIDGRISHYILLSSADVYRQYGLLHQREEGPADLVPLAEDAPLRASRFPYRGEQMRSADAPDRWMDDYDKIPIEQRVAAMRTPATILRLPMVFGPNDSQHRFLWAIRPMVEKQSEIRLPGSWLNWTSSFGFVDNIAAAVACVLDQPGNGCRTYNVMELESVPNRLWLERIAGIIGWHGAVEEDNSPDHPMAQRLAALDLAVPLIISGAKLAQELGFAPSVPVEEALAVTIKWETDQLRAA